MIEESNPDYNVLLELTSEMEKFRFFKETEQGRHIINLKSKTEQAIQTFEQLKSRKRSEDFDIMNYLKFLDNLTHSGLPLKAEVVEDARLEHKRENWIRKYNDL